MNRRKRIFMVILPSLLLIFVPFMLYKYSTSQTTVTAREIDSVSQDRQVVVYLSPHADDEVLTYSVPILNDLHEGKNVYVVLLSEGDRSFAREKVNGSYDYESLHIEKAGEKVYCQIHKTYHDPINEKYQDGRLSRFDLGQARIREFYLAVQALGVPKNQAEVFTLKNDKYSVEEVVSVVALYAQRFPDAQFKTMSKSDHHPDHAKIGLVLEKMYQKKLIKQPTFFFSIYMDRFTKKPAAGRRVYLTNKVDHQKVKKALEVYRTWQPHKGMYALGLHSVDDQFTKMMSDPYTTIDDSSDK